MDSIGLAFPFCLDGLLMAFPSCCSPRNQGASHISTCLYLSHEASFSSKANGFLSYLADDVVCFVSFLDQKMFDKVIV